MRRIFFKSAIVFACVVAALTAGMAAGRPLSMLLDRLHTVEIDSQPITQLGIEDASGGMLRINDLPMSTEAPDYRPFPIEMKVDAARQFVIQRAGYSIALGRLGDSLGQGHPLKPGPGDKARLSIDRTMLSWPTPLAFNFMSGQSPSWKRHLYYHLVWEKPNGGRLEMVWRYEQYFYQGWASGFMTRQGTTGLIRVDIRP